jgi:chaperonin cofactor prefoldin
MKELLETIATIITGAGIWEVIKLFYPDLKHFFSSRITAKKTFYENLDPILKSASELYGKLESLAKEDFSSFINTQNSNSKNPEHNQKYVLFLFSQFWAQLEYLRLESQYTSLSKNRAGNQLIRFIETIESRKYRVLDRSIQRIIGECLITEKDQKFRVMTLKDFLEVLENKDETLSKWILKLEELLKSVDDQDKKQLVLRFGVVVAALIDHFDPAHKTVRRRNLYSNKLTQKSKKHIKNNLTNHYLIFLKNKQTYYM